MRKIPLTRIIKEEIQNIREQQSAPLTDKVLSALDDIDVEQGNIKITDERTGKTTVVKLENGKFVKSDAVNEIDVKRAIVTAACAISLMGVVSCQKEDTYNLAKDARYILKPSILNTQGRESFDSPVGSKSKIYVWAGNQSGGRGTNNRVLYHDYSNQNKDYGAVYGQNYPDSFAYGANGITPVEVVKKFRLTSDVAKQLQPYSKVDLSQYTDTSTTLGKSDIKPNKSGLYVVIVKVYGSSHYDWADPNGGGEEIKDGKLNTGYGIYLVTPGVANGINVKEMYPTMMDIMFGTWNVSPSQVPGNSKIQALDNYMYNDFKNLLQDIPSI
jgi:hypothetical protein